MDLVSCWLAVLDLYVGAASDADSSGLLSGTVLSNGQRLLVASQALEGYLKG